MLVNLRFLFFFFNDTATTEIYTLSLHDALPICGGIEPPTLGLRVGHLQDVCRCLDRKSTRLNSSHLGISYAVFCLKKKKPIKPSRGLLSTISSIPHSSAVDRAFVF